MNIKIDIKWITETSETFDGTWGANLFSANPVWAEILNVEQSDPPRVLVL